jgi:L-malate glycosyltransferase
VLKNTDYVATVNENLRNSILELDIEGLKDKIQVTPNAVDLDKYHPHTQTDFAQEMGLNQDRSTILFVGNLVHQKGLPYLLKAKKLLKSDTELVIVGEGPLRTELQDMVKEQEIEGVVFPGARHDVYQVMPAADLLVLPSISEGLPMTLLEAFACGLPVVSTSVDGIPDLVTEDVGVLVEPRDPLALAEAIDQILQDDDLRRRMKKAARKKAKSYASLQIPY